MESTDSETKIGLPKGFLLGAASSAHQVEGHNMNSDWWQAEQQGRLPKSGAAADHYNRYQEDFKIARSIGLNAFRISIEWSRIEPTEGQWDKIAIEHYRKVLRNMKDNGLVRMVTLHHFTLPQWLAAKGGFGNHHGSAAFARFCWFVAQNLGDEVDYWCTINEPEVYSLLSYGRGMWPPFGKSTLRMISVFNSLIDVHKAAYAAIKEVLPNAQVGLAKNNVYYEAHGNNPLDKLAVKISNYFGNEYFLNRIAKHADFIGLNYYFYRSIKFTLGGFKTMNMDGPKSDMGWQTFPEGIYHLLANLKKYRKPIFITENGIANARDDMRQDYIRQHLEQTARAAGEGADVRGYFYWTLTDTYEWHDGFNPKFGLVEVNFETQERKIRASADIFKEIKISN